jgi:polysaccharide pyruvyl transferase CsaB
MHYRVTAFYTFNFIAAVHHFRRAKLFINGGGSLMQDVTSYRSLWFYLWTLSAAKRHGCPVIMYGCGIGPIQSPGNRARAAKVMNRYVDAITLRDPDSQKELGVLGVTKPQIALAADTTVILPAAPDDVVDGILDSCGIPADGNYIGFVLRPWPGFEGKTKAIAAAADYAYQTYGLTPVFFPIEPRLDVTAAQRVIAHMTSPYHIMTEAYTAAQTIGVLARMKTVVSMRLHGLIFAAGQGVPLVGIVYDQKVSSFLSYIGQDLYESLDSLSQERLIELIDGAVTRGKDPSFLSESVARLHRMEEVNHAILKPYVTEPKP